MIYVIDALCGSGKSTTMLETIKNSSNRKWLYITPFLTEVKERIPKELPNMKFKTPTPGKRGSKLSDIKNLIRNGHNIASTHALFRLFDNYTINLLLDKGYTIVIDESVEAITEYKDGLNQRDIHALLTGDFIIHSTDGRNKLTWNEEKYPEHDGKYADVRKLCMNNMLYCYENKFLMCEYPPKLLSESSEVYVLTYMFDACVMKHWLDINNIEYQYTHHCVLGLKDEKELKQQLKSNLEFISNRKLDKLQSKQGSTCMSKSWFRNQKKAKIDEYRAIIRSIFVSLKLKKKDVFWTTYKDYSHKLEDVGYSSTFLPLNIKATNDYKDKKVCIYAANLFSNVTEMNYLKSLGIKMTEEQFDSFCLSNLIQFMFRGCIRQNKPMKILILSKRVKNLLENWLES